MKVEVAVPNSPYGLCECRMQFLLPPFVQLYRSGRSTSRCQLKFRESSILRRKTRFVPQVEEIGGNIQNKNLMIVLLNAPLI